LDCGGKEEMKSLMGWLSERLGKGARGEIEDFDV